MPPDAPRDAWAPDLSWAGSEWRLYYAVSRFGTTNSVTALATTKSLDPASPDFGWVDRGSVLESEESSNAYDAIDASYVADARGGAWLIFGSFFGGLDQDGVSLLEGGGTEVLRGYNEFQGTGHPDVYSSDGVDYFVNHNYDTESDGIPRLNVRTLSWSRGWPRVSDPFNPSRSAGHGSAYVQPIPRGSAAVVSNASCGYAGANVTLAAASRTDICQQWQIDARDAKQVTDGSETGSRFQNRKSNMAADFPGCAEAQTSGNVGQFDWLGNFFYNVCQRWVFSPAPDGYTTISSIAGRNLVWTAEGLTPGANLGVSTPTGAANQWAAS